MYNFNLINADTDSIMVAKQNGEAFSEKEQQDLIEELNEMFPEYINWDEDGYFKKVIVVKAKNYILLEHGETQFKLKGSSIKDAKKEKSMREMMEKIIQALLDDKQDTIEGIYKSYVKEAMNVQDITRWCSKKSITESVMACDGYTEADIINKKIRRNETVVWDAVKHIEGLQQGDKVYLYPVILENKIIPGGVSEKTGKPLKDKVVEITGLKLSQNWKQDEDKLKLVERCFKTIEIFESVLDMDKFLDYNLKKNKSQLEELK